MWGNDIYLIPIAALLSMYKIEEDIHLGGLLSEEFPALISKYVPKKSLEVLVDESVSAEVNADYKKGTQVGMIFLDLVRQFSLTSEIYAMSDAIIKVTLKEAESGCFNSEPEV